MAYLRKRRLGRGTYYYIQESRRQRSGKIVSKILEYLGRNPDPKKLKRALKYWGVKDTRGRWSMGE